MLSLKCFKVAALALAGVGLGFAPASAYAGSCKSNRSVSYSHHASHHGHHDYGHRYSHRSRISTHHRGDNFRVSFSIGSSSRHCDSRQVVYRRASHRNDYQPRRVVRASRCDTPVVYQSSRHHNDGYWSQQYCPPVYTTRYRSCGTPYRVCTQAGYYKKVWVSFSH